LGSVGRGSVRSGSGSSQATAFAIEPVDINNIRRALRSGDADRAAALASHFILAGTGVDLLVAICQIAGYAYQKLEQYEEIVRLHGEEEANRRIAIEIGVDVAKKITTQLIVDKAIDELEAQGIVSPEWRERAEDVAEDVIESGIEELEKRFLEV